MEKNLLLVVLFIHTGGCKLSYSKSLTISYTVLFLKLIIDLDLGKRAANVINGITVRFLESNIACGQPLLTTYTQSHIL